jgi:hypothetical protein
MCRCGVDAKGAARLVRSGEKVLEQGVGVITHAEAENENGKWDGGSKTQLPITKQAHDYFSETCSLSFLHMQQPLLTITSRLRRGH